MVVVLAIIGILMAIVLTQFHGSKRAANYRVATAAAVTYGDAIEAYMADNGQVPPVLGSTAWPSTSRAQRIGGPLNRMLVDASNKPRRYMKLAAPEEVQSGIVDFGTDKSSARPNASAYITYQIVNAEYRLLVETLPRGTNDEVLKCVVTNGTTLPSGYQRCG
jgi:type II secretory pathway pseudopilin PulG